MIQERISNLRKLMRERKIDVYIIPSDDNHQSEYVGEHFKSRAFITGFTGSAGTAVITLDKAGLWTDGRYFIQAEKELKGTEITLYKSGTPGVPTIEEFLDKVLGENCTLGFNGKVVSMIQGQRYEQRYASKKVSIESKYDLVDEIWSDRPPMSLAPAFLLDECYSGESSYSKLKKIRKIMKQQNATIHLLSSLDDIAWLLNIRGRDTLYTPVILCYAAVTQNQVHLFIDKQKISEEIATILDKNHVYIHPYDTFYDYAKKLPCSESILLDPKKVNYTLYNSIPADITCIECDNPTEFLKCIKNETEISNIKAAHIKDAVAHTKFMYWLKTSYQSETITELSASEKLESLRAEQEHFLWPSFEPISAFGPHAAMCHYSSTKETDVVLQEGSLYLSDTGGNYLEGSTDITRTVALGEIPYEMRAHFTNVLRGNLALANTKFLYGCTGENLDILARQYLWNMNLDYKHGTGHGIGYLLSIHEGPCNIRWQYRNTPIVLQEGMILSDEPGIYIENSHGIRLENELLVQKDVCNEYGQFMKFEILTFVPFDLDAIEPSLLSQTEKEQLNTYHKQVYDMVSPYLTEEETQWLRHYTRAI